MQPPPVDQAPLTSDDLRTVARTRVFFGHQSVGQNMLDAVPRVYADHGLDPVPVVRDGAAGAEAGGFIEHTYIGQNENPDRKIDDFAARLRGGTGRRVDVALMKFCYIDITTRTDVAALFARYRTTAAQLQREFPDLALLHVTVPLMTEPGLATRARALATRSDRFLPAENAARERINVLIRQEYSGGRLFDLAAVESTIPDGSRVTGTADGMRYFALHKGYASDNGHLNSDGAARAAAALLKALAGASAA